MPAAEDNFLDGPQVNLGLAGAGYAVDQQAAELVAIDQGLDPLQGQQLLVGQLRQLLLFHRHVEVADECLGPLDDDLDQAFFLEGLHDGGRAAGHAGQFPGRYGVVHGVQTVEHSLLLRQDAADVGLGPVASNDQPHGLEAGLFLDRGRQDGRQHLPQRRYVIAGHPAGQVHQVGVDQGLGVNCPADLFDFLEVGLGKLLGHITNHRLVSTAEGYLDPQSGRDLPAQIRRHGVSIEAVQRQIQGHLHEGGMVLGVAFCVGFRFETGHVF